YCGVQVSTGQMAGAINGYKNPNAPDHRHLEQPGVSRKKHGYGYGTDPKKYQDKGAQHFSRKAREIFFNHLDPPSWWLVVRICRDLTRPDDCASLDSNLHCQSLKFISKRQQPKFIPRPGPFSATVSGSLYLTLLPSRIDSMRPSCRRIFR